MSFIVRGGGWGVCVVVFGSVMFPKGFLESCGSHLQSEGHIDKNRRERKDVSDFFHPYYIDSLTDFCLSSEELFTCDSNKMLTWGCS